MREGKLAHDASSPSLQWEPFVATRPVAKIKGRRHIQQHSSIRLVSRIPIHPIPTASAHFHEPQTSIPRPPRRRRNAAGAARARLRDELQRQRPERRRRRGRPTCRPSPPWAPDPARGHHHRDARHRRDLRPARHRRRRPWPAGAQRPGRRDRGRLEGRLRFGRGRDQRGRRDPVRLP